MLYYPCRLARIGTMLKTIFEFVMDMLETVVFVGAMFIVVNWYILQPSQVKGSSMVPTLHNNDRIFVSRITYKLEQPKRGDIVVIKSPENQETEFVKRVIGLPGEIIRFESCTGPFRSDCDVFVNDEKLEEKYLETRTQLFDNSLYEEGQEILIPEGKLFVMGDNRTGSLDSRIFGPISMESVVGVVFYRYFPTNVAGKFSSPAYSL